MPSAWYYQFMGEVIGPISAEDLKKLVAQRIIENDTRVRQGEDGSWVAADKVRGLGFKRDFQPAATLPPPDIESVATTMVSSSQRSTAASQSVPPALPTVEPETRTRAQRWGIGRWLVATVVLPAVVILGSLSLLGFRQPIVRAEVFEPLYRSVKRIEGSVDVGVNRAQLHQQLQEFSTEISIARDFVNSDAERKILGLYERTLATYTMSADIWTLSSYRKIGLASDFEREMSRVYALYHDDPSFQNGSAQPLAGYSLMISTTKLIPVHSVKRIASRPQETEFDYAPWLLNSLIEKQNVDVEQLRESLPQYELETVQRSEYVFVRENSVQRLWEVARATASEAKALHTK